MKECGRYLIISLRGEARIVPRPERLDLLEVWVPLESEGEEILQDPEVQELVRSLPETVLVEGGSGKLRLTLKTYETLQALRKKLKGGEE